MKRIGIGQNLGVEGTGVENYHYLSANLFSTQ